MQFMPLILVFNLLTFLMVFPKTHLVVPIRFSPVANSVHQLPWPIQVPHCRAAASPQHGAE